MDFKEVQARSEFRNLFPGSTQNHYTGTTEEGAWIFSTHTGYSGMMAEDVHLTIGESIRERSTPAGIIRTNGIIEIAEQD